MYTGSSFCLNLWYTFIVCSVKTSASFRILYSLNNGSVCAFVFTVCDYSNCSFL